MFPKVKFATDGAAFPETTNIFPKALEIVFTLFAVHKFPIIGDVKFAIYDILIKNNITFYLFLQK